MLRYAPELVALSLGNNYEIRELLDSQLMSPHSIRNGKQTELYGLYLGVVTERVVSSLLAATPIITQKQLCVPLIAAKSTIICDLRKRSWAKGD